MQPTVAVIGCGPGGISFLHAVETRKRNILQEYGGGAADTNDDNNDHQRRHLAKLPVVTVFERNSLPGGVWRSHAQEEKDEDKEEQEKKQVLSFDRLDSHQAMKAAATATAAAAAAAAAAALGDDKDHRLELTPQKRSPKKETSGCSPTSDSEVKSDHRDDDDVEEERTQEDTDDDYGDELSRRSFELSIRPVPVVEKDRTVLLETTVSANPEDEDASEDEDDDDEDSTDDEEEEDSDYILEGRTRSSTSMYEALWTNGPCQGIEFADYTFEEHFQKKALPIFLPRSAVLPYLLKRVTRNCPTFFDSVRFNTCVQCIDYIETMDKFEITSYDEVSKERKVEYFDECIWAAGNNGCAKIPKSIRSILEGGGFRGSDVHSSQAAKHLGELRGKRVVFIGDGLSAEDLALQAIKLGIGMIYVIARSGDGVCSYTNAWPEGKVEVINNFVISEVIDDGYGLRLVEVEYDPSTETKKKIENGDIYDLHDISAVVYCTGYHPNYDMINDSIGIEEEEYEEGYKHNLPDGWKMEKNALNDILGDVKPSNFLWTDNNYFSIWSSKFRGIDESNTKMKYLCEGSAQSPLLEIDVRAWYFLALIMKEVELPSRAEMKELKRQVIHKAMQSPFIRYEMDAAYYRAWTLHAEAIDNLAVNMDEMGEEALKLPMIELAEEMRDGSYICQLLGPDGELNEKGRLLTYMSNMTDLERSRQRNGTRNTFRDMDPSSFKSIHTGQQAVSLKSLWLDIDDEDPDLLSVQNEFV